MNFSDYFDETEGYLGWDYQEDLTSWYIRIRQLKEELRSNVRSVEPDNISGRVKENVTEEQSIYGEREVGRKTIQSNRPDRTRSRAFLNQHHATTEEFH